LPRPGFRRRLFIVLTVFAAIPSLAVTFLWWATVSKAVPVVSGSAAWDRVAVTGQRALESVATAPLTPEQRAALRAHEDELAVSVTQARRFQFLAARFVPVGLVAGLLLLAVLGLVTSRVAGHLSRQLSRPIDELVGWADRLAHREPLPPEAPRRGAPEFEVLRTRLRAMAQELDLARARELEAERLRAFRETARQVAHELKNPLTPIRFAVERLRRDAPPSLGEAVEVLAIESQRLEEMARSFSAFGRLPEGPAAEVDIGELARYTARATVPEQIGLDLDIPQTVPMVRGHHDALARALSNVLLNAVDACRQTEGGRVGVEVMRDRLGEREAVRLVVRDSGCGIAADKLGHIWEPYVTHKPGGTGLGLAIVRQTVLAHGGRVDAASEIGRGTEISFTLPLDGGRPPEEARVHSG
jgi:signal transduction histidine kinase